MTGRATHGLHALARAVDLTILSMRTSGPPFRVQPAGARTPVAACPLAWPRRDPQKIGPGRRAGRGRRDRHHDSAVWRGPTGKGARPSRSLRFFTASHTGFSWGSRFLSWKREVGGFEALGWVRGLDPRRSVHDGFGIQPTLGKNIELLRSIRYEGPRYSFRWVAPAPVPRDGLARFAQGPFPSRCAPRSLRREAASGGRLRVTRQPWLPYPR
jgi:hypothetical protein